MKKNLLFFVITVITLISFVGCEPHQPAPKSVPADELRDFPKDENGNPVGYVVFERSWDGYVDTYIKPEDLQEYLKKYQEYIDYWKEKNYKKYK